MKNYFNTDIAELNIVDKPEDYNGIIVDSSVQSSMKSCEHQCIVLPVLLATLSFQNVFMNKNLTVRNVVHFLTPITVANP